MEGNALQEKSNMLDEVNKLLDLMVDEKKCLHQKIAKLELQLESNHCQGEKLEKIIQTDPQHEATPPSTSNGHCVSDLVAIVMEERARLQEMDCRVEQVNTYCTQERDTARVELRKTKELLHRSDSSLQAHKRETKTLEAKLSDALKVQKELKDSSNDLHRSLEEMRIKYMKTRTSLLAIRGRKSVDLKRTNKIEQDNERRELVSILEKEQEIKSRLQKQLQAKEKEVVNFKTLVANKEDQLSTLSEKYEELRLGVEDSLNILSKDLKSSRSELERVQQTLKSKQEQLDKTHLMLQEERRKSAHLLSQSCSSVTHLTSQLEKERKDHEEQQYTTSMKMVELQTQHAIEMDRLRDISAKRCKELAREVWTIKATKK